MYIFLFIISVLLIRGLETYFFVKKVSKLCYDYDWEHIERNPLLVLDVMDSNEYYEEKEWSAYNFLLFKGPTPYKLMFSLKKLDIYKIYDKELLKRLEKYEII